MDSDTSSNLDDHGPKMDTALSTYDNLSANLDTISAQSNDPSMNTGPSTFQPSVFTTRRHLRCVNCGLNVTRIRRHLLEIAEVRNLVQQWVQSRQVQVSSDSLVCHSCWTAAWDRIRNPSQEPQDTPADNYRHVCITCGRSLVRGRVHTLRSETPREARIRNMIASQIAPEELPRSPVLCHTCWRRTDRAATRLADEQGLTSVTSPPEVTHSGNQKAQPSLPISETITLHNYMRAPHNQSRCFYPRCTESDRHVVPIPLRVRLFCDYHYYIPANCKICSHHLRLNDWESLLESIENPIRTFSANQIEDFAALLMENMVTDLDFDDINSLPDHIVHYHIGHTKEQFNQILIDVPRLSLMYRGSFALAAYLIKLRTGDSDERLSALLKAPRSTLERLMSKAREILNQDYVPLNLGINHI